MGVVVSDSVWPLHLFIKNNFLRALTRAIRPDRVKQGIVLLHTIIWSGILFSAQCMCHNETRCDGGCMEAK